jgi:hypothetical protein
MCAIFWRTIKNDFEIECLYFEHANEAKGSPSKAIITIRQH